METLIVLLSMLSSIPNRCLVDRGYNQRHLW